MVPVFIRSTGTGILINTGVEFEPEGLVSGIGIPPHKAGTSTVRVSLGPQPPPGLETG
jgi:hypothetical protein